MGHADIQTTYDIYAEVTDLKKKESFENLAKNLKIFQESDSYKIKIKSVTK